MGRPGVRNQIVHHCHYQVVWCTKWRRPVLTTLEGSADVPPLDGDPGPIDVRLLQIIRQVCRETSATLFEVEIQPDFVRLLVGCDPRTGIHKLVHTLKARSSGPLRREFPSLRRRLPTLWTNSYLAVTVGGDPSGVIASYIAGQRRV